MHKVFFNAMQKLSFLALLLAVFSIHLPTKFMDIMLAVLFISWALSGDYVAKINRIKSNVGALSAIGLFLAFSIGMLYSSVPLHESFRGWFKYHGLLFIPIAVSILQKKSERDFAILTYILGALLVVLLCYGKWLGLVPMDFVRDDATAGNYIVFRHSISQNIFVAIAIYLMMIKAKSSEGLIQKLWVIAYLLSLGSILFLVDSRSAQIAMALMTTFFLYLNWKPAYIKYIAGFLVLAAVMIYSFSPQMRIMDIGSEIELAKNEQKVTSSGQRLELWTNTWSLIERKPILGGGAGSFVHEYSTFVPKERIVTVLDYKNVHSQYLTVLQEFGFLGLSFLIIFFLYQWEAASRSSLADIRQSFQGLIITYVATSFFNSMFWGGEAKCYYLMAGVFLSAAVIHKRNKWRINLFNSGP
jgi:O-antigen ligase